MQERLECAFIAVMKELDNATPEEIDAIRREWLSDEHNEKSDKVIELINTICNLAIRRAERNQSVA